MRSDTGKQTAEHPKAAPRSQLPVQGERITTHLGTDAHINFLFGYSHCGPAEPAFLPIPYWCCSLSFLRLCSLPILLGLPLVQTLFSNSIVFLGSQRFEHKSADKSAARKIEAPVRFPASLNMAPYTTLIMHRQEQFKESGIASASLVP